MRVDWAIACRYVEVNGALATIVGAGIDTYYPPAFPADLSVIIALRVVGAHTDDEHLLVATVLDPQMQEIARVEGGFTSQLNPDAIPGWEAGAILTTVHNFRAEEEGPYTITITVDGQAHTVPVIVRPQPA